MRTVPFLSMDAAFFTGKKVRKVEAYVPVPGSSYIGCMTIVFEDDTHLLLEPDRGDAILEATVTYEENEMRAISVAEAESRLRFYNWANREGYDMAYTHSPNITFLNPSTTEAWKVWQASQLYEDGQ